MESDLAFYIISGAAVGVGGLLYTCKRSVISKVVSLSSWAVNTYIDLKWAYMGEPQIAQHVKREDNDECCRLDHATANHIVYEYQQKLYISPSSVPPIRRELDEVYDPDEHIQDIKLYAGNHRVYNTDDVDKVTEIINSFIGPLYDFHGVIPTINDLQEFCDVQLLQSVDQIAITTEYMREFVLKNKE